MNQKIQEYVLRISEIIDDTPSVKVFRVELPKDADVGFYPGQFFMVSFVDDPEIKTGRAYSIASSPLNKRYLEIALNEVGPFTQKLFQMKDGDLLRFKGPYGKFYFHDDMKNNLVLVGGGTGITPLMSIIRYWNEKNLTNKVKFFYSVKTPSDIIYENELEQIKKSNENFDCVVTVTRAEENNDWHGRKGRIDLELLREHIENFEENLYFLCGPKEFVDNVISMLQNLGAKREQIKTDIWG